MRPKFGDGSFRNHTSNEANYTAKQINKDSSIVIKVVEGFRFVGDAEADESIEIKVEVEDDIKEDERAEH